MDKKAQEVIRVSRHLVRVFEDQQSTTVEVDDCIELVGEALREYDKGVQEDTSWRDDAKKTIHLDFTGGEKQSTTPAVPPSARDAAEELVDSMKDYMTNSIVNALVKYSIVGSTTERLNKLADNVNAAVAEYNRELASPSHSTPKVTPSENRWSPPPPKWSAPLVTNERKV